MQETLVILQKREEFLEKKSLAQVEEAKKCLAAKNKRGKQKKRERRRDRETSLSSSLSSQIVRFFGV
jgi:hypothetical protein